MSRLRPAVVGWVIVSAMLSSLGGCVAGSATAPADSPAPAAPHADYVLLDEQPVSRFVVQRWIRRGSPPPSPAGYCDCLTVVLEAGHVRLDLGPESGITTVSALPDVTGDAREELVVHDYTGGAHCCNFTRIFSFDTEGPRPLLSLSTGHCEVQLVDLDGDGRAEVRTCDDHFAYAFCSFADSPKPPVVLAFDRGTGRFEVATRRFAREMPEPSLDALRAEVSAAGARADVQRCVALGPVIDRLYTDGEDSAQQLLGAIYDRPDRAALWSQILEIARRSPLYTASR
jgi:hypothetical protein